MRLENAVNGEGIKRQVEVGRGGKGKKIYLLIHPPSSLPFLLHLVHQNLRKLFCPYTLPPPLHDLPSPNKLKRLRVDRGVVWWWELTG